MYGLNVMALFGPRKSAALQASEKKTDALAATVEELTARVERLKAVGTIITVRAEPGSVRGT